MRPSGPHIQPQNITDTKIDTELTLRRAAERDRREHESFERGDRDRRERDERHHRRGLELQDRGGRRATMMIVGPKYGMQFNTPAATPHRPA